MKLTVAWKNGKVTETITDDVDWYVKLLRSNKKVYIWYMVSQAEPNSVVSNLRMIESLIKFNSLN